MEMLNVKIKYKKLSPVSFVFFLVVQRFSTLKAVRVLKEFRDGLQRQKGYFMESGARIFWTFKEPKNPFQGINSDSSVAYPGCLSRIPELGSRIQKQQWKTGVKTQLIVLKSIRKELIWYYVEPYFISDKAAAGADWDLANIRFGK